MEQPWIGDELPVLRGGAEREELEPGMLDELLKILVGSDCHTVAAPAQANAYADERMDVAMRAEGKDENVHALGYHLMIGGARFF